MTLNEWKKQYDKENPGKLRVISVKTLLEITEFEDPIEVKNSTNIKKKCTVDFDCRHLCTWNDVCRDTNHTCIQAHKCEYD